MNPAPRLSLKRESLAELSEAALAEVGGGEYSGNPFCIASVLAECVTTLCSKVKAVCLPDIHTS